MKYFLALVFIILSGCALPTKARVDFVPTSEILAANLNSEGRALFNSGRYMEAELEFRKLLYLYPDSERGKLNLASSLQKLGLFDEGALTLRELSDKYPEKEAYKERLALLLLKSGDAEDGVQILETLASAREENKRPQEASRALRNISTTNYIYGREIEALCTSSDSIALTPSREERLRHLRLLVSMNRFSSAEIMAQEEMEKDGGKKNPYLLHLSALLFIEKDALEDALLLEEEASRLVQRNKDLEFEIKLFSAILRDKLSKYEDEEEQNSFVDKLKILLKDRRLSDENSLFWTPKAADLAFEYKDNFLEDSEQDLTSELLKKLPSREEIWKLLSSPFSDDA